MKKIVSLLLLCASLTLCGGEINLSTLAPSYTAAAGKIDVAVLLQMPQVRQFLSLAPEDINGVRPDDVTEIIFGCDRKAVRGFLICKFRDEAGWQRLWQALDGRITPLPAERRIMLFELKNSKKQREKFYFAVLAPRVAAFYSDDSGKGNFRCDYAGIPENAAEYLDSSMPFYCGGKLKTRNHALRGIRSFSISPALGDDGFAAIRAEVVCSEPVMATLTGVALQGAIAAGLQEFCGLPPDKTAELMRRIKMRQNDEKIIVEFTDFAYLSRILNQMMVAF